MPDLLEDEMKVRFARSLGKRDEGDLGLPELFKDEIRVRFARALER